MTDMNPHLVTAASEWGPRDAPLTVLGLHGRGQSPDLIADLRARTGDESFRWIAPAAAEHSWYPFRFMEEPAAADPWLQWSLDAVDARLDALAREGVLPERVVLLGFSQGACLLVHHALRHPRRYAGLAILTGGYIGVPWVDPYFIGDLGGTPALLATREADDWVPLARVRETEEHLRDLGAELTVLVEPPGEHAVSDSAALLLGRFLAEVAAAAQGATGTASAG
jgi:phospholipase/carboxylesterase